MAMSAREVAGGWFHAPKPRDCRGRPPLVTDSGVRHSRNLYSATKAASNLWKQPLVESVRWDLFRKWGVKVRRTSVLDPFQVKHTSLPRGEENCVSLEFDPPRDRPTLFSQEADADIRGRGRGRGEGEIQVESRLLQPKSNPFLSPVSWTYKTRALPEPRPSPEMRHRPPPRSDQAALHGEPPHSRLRGFSSPS